MKGELATLALQKCRATPGVRSKLFKAMADMAMEPPFNRPEVATVALQQSVEIDLQDADFDADEVLDSLIQVNTHEMPLARTSSS